MRNPACPLVLALIAFASCVQITTGATEQKDVARPQLPGLWSGPRAQQGQRSLRQSPQTVNLRPRVATPLVTVDRNRVPLGERVTFTLTPAGVVMSSRSKVTIYFGDGEHRLIQNKIDWWYGNTGNYTYSILVEPSSPTPTPTPAPPFPGVKLSATPGSVEINRPVDFAAQLSHSYPNIKYRFVFADGSQTEWRDVPQTTHSYRSPGSYRAYVDIGLGNGGSLKSVVNSPRQAIEVTLPSVTLTTLTTPNNRRTPPRGTPTPPRGTPTPSRGTPTPPRETPTPSPSGPVPIASPSPTGSESPSPNASPSVPGTPSPTPDGSGSPLIGGDTSPPSPTPSPTATPTPNPTPDGGGSLSNWWKYLLAALILFAGYQGFKYLYAPRPTLVPNVDPGVSALGADGGPLAIDFQMELDPNVTDGQFTVDPTGGSLIKSERKSDG